MNKYKVGDVVWVDLGSSYGWWPGVMAEEHEIGVSRDGKSSINPKEVKGGEAPPEKRSRRGNKEDAERFRVHFFDDESREAYFLSGTERLRPYSCEDKEDLVKEGLKKFGTNKNPKSLLDFRARQAQFYKDVEMAEVLTDSSPAVADILAQYEVVEGEEGQNSSTAQPPAKRRRKGRGKSKR